MDEAEGILPVDDVHTLAGCLMVMVAGLHALLHLGVMWSYATRRIRELAGQAPHPDRS